MLALNKPSSSLFLFLFLRRLLLLLLAHGQYSACAHSQTDTRRALFGTACRNPVSSSGPSSPWEQAGGQTRTTDLRALHVTCAVALATLATTITIAPPTLLA